MIYNNFTFTDLFKSDIHLFINKITEDRLLSFNLMSISGIDILEEENVEIDLEKINLTIHREKFNVTLKNERNKIEINRNPLNTRKIGIGIHEEKSEISDLVFKYFGLSSLQYVKRDHMDHIGWDRTLDYDFWIYMKRPIPEPMEYFPIFDFHNPNKKGLSVEHVPTHTHYMRLDEELIFESCWQMYFGEIYYKYIPKPLFDSFDDCFENIILEEGVRKITLYEDVTDYTNLDNIAKIWLFRRKLGIDSIGHELTRAKNRIEPKDLPVLISKKNCMKGTTRVTRFLNTENKLVPESIAIKKEITEYNDDGINPILQEIQLL